MNKEPHAEYVLDTNVLIKHPDVLSRANSSVKFWIPTVVITQLASYNKGNRSSSIYDATMAAIASRLAAVPTGFDINSVDLSMNNVSLEFTDKIILKNVLFLVNSSNNVKLVTDDIKFTLIARSLIQVINSNELLKEIEKQPLQNNVVTRKLSRVIFYRRLDLIVGLLFGVFSGVVGNLAVNNSEVLSRHIHEIGYVFFCFLILNFGLVIFWLRQRFRVAYAFTEIAVGIVSSVNVAFNIDQYQVDGTTTLQILGGIYIIIRGLDNLGKGLQGSNLGLIWNNIFEK